jgi:hypothetical protein
MTRRMRQPRKDVLREQLALAADRIIAERMQAEYTRGIYEFALWRASTPWWRHLWNSITGKQS